MGFADMASENAFSVGGVLQGLADRGLHHEAGLLCVIDGAKGRQKAAVREVFGPYVVIGLRGLWCNPPVREKISKILRRHVRPEVSHRRGRPEMDLWCIFVLRTLKQALGCDYDRLKELVDEQSDTSSDAWIF